MAEVYKLRAIGMSQFSGVSLGDGFVGVVGDLGQHILEVVEGIDTEAAAGLADGEVDGAALAAIGVADRAKWKNQSGFANFRRG